MIIATFQPKGRFLLLLLLCCVRRFFCKRAPFAAPGGELKVDAITPAYEVRITPALLTYTLSLVTVIA
jgi:hypothetical protein